MTVIKDKQEKLRTHPDSEPLTMLHGIRVVSAEEWDLIQTIRNTPYSELCKPAKRVEPQVEEPVIEEPIKEEPKCSRGKWKRKNRKRTYNRPHPDMIQAILDRDNHTCVECGATDHLEVHHMIHRKDGGEHTEDNLITLCWVCHAEKHKEEPVYNLMMSRIRKLTT